MPDILMDMARSNLVPFIQGDPGTAKSACVKQFAKDNNLKLIDIRLATCDPTDLVGFPRLDGDRMDYSPLRQIPLAEDPLNGFDGFILFLDEFNSAPVSVQAASYKLILDKKVGNRSLHQKCLTVCAGNLCSNKAITNKLSTAMQSRLVNITLSMTTNDWLKWAVQNNIDQRVISFIKFKPDLLHRFNPNHNDKTFPCARTWEFLSNYIKSKTKLDHVNLVVMAGCISEGPATEFKAFSNIYKHIPDIEHIINNPTTFEVKDEPSYQHALSTLISHNIEKAPSELLIAVERFPIEFQIVCLRESIARKPSNFNLKQVSDWCEKNSNDLF